jgi:hypothetical protein
VHHHHIQVDQLGHQDQRPKMHMQHTGNFHSNNLPHLS